MEGEWKKIDSKPLYRRCKKCRAIYDLNEVSRCPVCFEEEQRKEKHRKKKKLDIDFWF
jgi:rRNA maturation endonuclease Nob1